MFGGSQTFSKTVTAAVVVLCQAGTDIFRLNCSHRRGWVAAKHLRKNSTSEGCNMKLPRPQPNIQDEIYPTNLKMVVFVGKNHLFWQKSKTLRFLTYECCKCHATFDLSALKVATLSAFIPWFASMPRTGRKKCFPNSGWHISENILTRWIVQLHTFLGDGVPY